MALPPLPRIQEDFAQKLTLEVDVDPTPPPLTIGTGTAFSPLRLEIATGSSSSGCGSDDSGCGGNRQHDGSNGGATSGGGSSGGMSSSSKRRHATSNKSDSKTLSISKSGSIHIAGFEIRKSGLTQTSQPIYYKHNSSIGGQLSTTPSSGSWGESSNGAASPSFILSNGPGRSGEPMSPFSTNDSGRNMPSVSVSNDTQSLQDALAPLAVLGRGAGGTVWQGIHVPSLRLVAVKTILVFEEGRRHQMVRELRALYANLAPLGRPTPTPPAGAAAAAAPAGTGYPSKNCRKGSGKGKAQRKTAVEHEDLFAGGLSKEAAAAAAAAAAAVGKTPPTQATAAAAVAAAATAGCPQLVSFYDAYVSPTEGTVSIVQEYMDGGSLQEIVDGGGCAAEAVLSHIAREVLEGLAFLHERRQIHRDIKPANLLLNHKGQVKISDFGLVRHLDSSISQADTFVGTFTYMSPERICGEEYSYSADVWGVGLTLVTCAMGRFPYDHSGGYWGLVSALREMDSPSLPPSFSPSFRDFVRQCLNKDPKKRPTARYLLKHHPFLQRGGEGGREGGSRWVVPPASPGGYGAEEEEEEEEEGGMGGGSVSARRELMDIVQVVKAYYRRLWNDSSSSSCSSSNSSTSSRTSTSTSGSRSGGAQGGILLLPNTQAQALAGLARQLGVPSRVVREAFRMMLRELIEEQVEGGREKEEEDGAEARRRRGSE
ncbi:ste ste7 protein kinase [Nannochloropsis oceanica]